MEHFEKPGKVDLEFRPGKRWAYSAGREVVFQTDGDLVVINPSKKVVWSSGTGGRGATLLKMQADGNLVIYSRHTVSWSSGTNDNPGATLAFQNDGNVVLYSASSKPLWATGTFDK